jgi:diadenosine tetraphosphate (Ap4A) HIT family hydrolase
VSADSAIHRRVAALRVAADPTFVARLDSGWVVMGDPQVLAGYCLLLPDPVVADLNSLRGHERSSFLSDLASLGDALLTVTGAIRCNYAIFGNVARANPWGYDGSAAPRFSAAQHSELILRLRAVLFSG